MSRQQQLIEITPRPECDPGELFKELVLAGHPVLGVVIEGERWFLALGRQIGEGEGRRYEDVSPTEAAAAAMAAAVLEAPAYSLEALKEELEGALGRIARLSAEPVIYAAELQELRSRRAELVAEIEGLAAAALKRRS